VLFGPIQRRVVKPLAKELSRRFGSFGEVIAASPQRLMEVDGVGEVVIAALKTVETAAHRLSKTELLGRPALSSGKAVLHYCAAAMARAETEQFRILFLDRKNTLTAEEVHPRGTVDHTPVYARDVVKRARTGDVHPDPPL
jgi:DNA repair protein RadC